MALADAEGNYALDLDWGRYQVAASKDGYLTTWPEPVYLVGGQTTEQNIVLAEAPVLVYAPLILH